MLQRNSMDFRKYSPAKSLREHKTSQQMLWSNKRPRTNYMARSGSAETCCPHLHGVPLALARLLWPFLRPFYFIVVLLPSTSWGSSSSLKQRWDPLHVAFREAETKWVLAPAEDSRTLVFPWLGAHVHSAPSLHSTVPRGKLEQAVPLDQATWSYFVVWDHYSCPYYKWVLFNISLLFVCFCFFYCILKYVLKYFMSMHRSVYMCTIAHAHRDPQR